MPSIFILEISLRFCSSKLLWNSHENSLLVFCKFIGKSVDEIDFSIIVNCVEISFGNSRGNLSKFSSVFYWYSFRHFFFLGIPMKLTLATSLKIPSVFFSENYFMLNSFEIKFNNVLHIFFELSFGIIGKFLRKLIGFYSVIFWYFLRKFGWKLSWAIYLEILSIFQLEFILPFYLGIPLRFHSAYYLGISSKFC